jgi:phage-related protein
MSEITEITYTEEAEAEIDALPATDRARVLAKIQLVKDVGWQMALREQRVKKLRGEIYEVRITGRGAAYRVFCFPHGAQRGRLVVTTSCVKKSWLLKKRRMQTAVERAELRRQKWLAEQGEQR